MSRPIPPPSPPPPPRPKLRRSTLERLAAEGWEAWGVYAKATTCDGCGAIVYCRASRPGGPFLCLGCFDQR